MGSWAGVDKTEPTNIPVIGETMFIQDNSISAPRIPYIHSNVVLAYKGVNNDYKDILSRYDWNIEIMSAIILAESSGNPFAINEKDSHKGCNGSYGLLQIGCVHIGKHIEEEDLFDIEKNIEAGYEVYKKQGLKAWTTFTDGSYLKYL